MDKLTRIEARPGHRLYVVFEDGTEGEVDLSERLKGPVLEPLRNPTVFAQVTIDEFGAPCWPNGADWAPDAIYLEVRQSAEAVKRAE